MNKNDHQRKNNQKFTKKMLQLPPVIVELASGGGAALGRGEGVAWG